MENTITGLNSSTPIMVVVPCVLTAKGLIHRLNIDANNGLTITAIKVIDEAYAKVLLHSRALVILHISESSVALAEEIKFISWCQTVQPQTVIIAYTHNHNLSVLNYISALGVRVIISQYESAKVVTDLMMKALNAQSVICSPMIKNILQGRVSHEMTACEVQVLGQLFLGRNVSQVAQSLGRDIRTVSAHKRHAMEKLGLHCEKDLHVLGCMLSGKQ